METKTKNALVAIGIMASTPYLFQKPNISEVNATTLQNIFYIKREKTAEVRRAKPQTFGTFSLLPEATPYIGLILKTSEKYDIDPAIILAVMKNESHFNPMARSKAGAVGLMQVLPKTASWLLKKNITTEELEVPSKNIEVGTSYLAYIKKRIKHLPRSKHKALLFAGYNAGHTRVLNGTIPNIKETKNYVKKCLKTYEGLS